MKQTSKIKNKSNNKSLGNKGEIIAYQYLITKGFNVLERNYRKKVGEIDIICKKNEVLHFIEVKTISIKNPKPHTLHSIDRGESSFIRPEDNLHKQKIKQVMHLAEIYRLDRKLAHIQYQIDALAIYLHIENKIIIKAQVRYIPNIYI